MKTIANTQNAAGDRIAGGILIATSLLMVFAMLHHPVPHAHSFEELIEEVDSIQFINQLIHGGAIVFVMLMVLGLTSFCSRMGFQRITVRGGMISFSVGAMAMIAAALVSGFIVPSFLNGYPVSEPSDAEIGQRILRALRSFNGCLDLLGVASMSTAVILFGVSALTAAKRLWVIGLLGLVTGSAGCIGIFSGHTQATVPGVIGFAILLAVWIITVGVFLCQRPRQEQSHDE